MPAPALRPHGRLARWAHVLSFRTISGKLIIGLVVLLLYGGVLLGAMPVLHQCGGVSWQGHLSGAVAGVVAAYLLSAPERKSRALKKAGTGSPRVKT